MTEEVLNWEYIYIFIVLLITYHRQQIHKDIGTYKIEYQENESWKIRIAAINVESIICYTVRICNGEIFEEGILSHLLEYEFYHIMNDLKAAYPIFASSHSKQRL